MATMLIKNGRVVSTTGVIAQDVLITDETITALGAPGYFTEEGIDKVVDADGKLVIPGGIDVHTHMELPFGGTFAKDDFFTGTRAAAPAEVFHAAAFRPTERRCGTMTPWPPNAATERMIAPRLRGSVTPSSATSSGFSPRSSTWSSTSSGCAYS